MLSTVYVTHSILCIINTSICSYVVCLLVHSYMVSSRYQYSLSLHVEMVWLLTPTTVVATLIARVVALQVAEEELTIQYVLVGADTVVIGCSIPVGYHAHCACAPPHTAGMRYSAWWTDHTWPVPTTQSIWGSRDQCPADLCSRDPRTLQVPHVVRSPMWEVTPCSHCT